jgi:hypothetical protein
MGSWAPLIHLLLAGCPSASSLVYLIVERGWDFEGSPPRSNFLKPGFVALRGPALWQSIIVQSQSRSCAPTRLHPLCFLELHEVSRWAGWTFCIE